ncbi:glycosyl hydrolase [Leptolyngbya sp. FACHB-17]|nr:glycosyl hydrolase [Leptolyngbya sp. FACHB-17]
MLRLLVRLTMAGLIGLGGLVSCAASPQRSTSVASPQRSTSVSSVEVANYRSLLTESWTAYRKRFIQVDGRVIDWEANGRSTSEGQAYALLRAVMMNDPETFAIALQWAETNLQRRDKNNKSIDSLWAWKWGHNPKGYWGILDANVASDADIDAITALILASRRWQRPDYLKLARIKLKDLWAHATIPFPIDGKRYLLPGAIALFQRNEKLKANPSYLAPYAFRLFSQVDSERDWLSLVDSSYQMLEQSSDISPVGLPSDWIAVDPKTGFYTAIDPSSSLITQYSFDAIRVWWRVALDATWFGEPRAKAYLKAHLGYLRQMWQRERKIPAKLDLQGRPLVDYEATSQYGMLYAAFRVIDPAIAQEIFTQKLLPSYRNGFWDNDSAYYSQNLAWFGLFPPNTLATYLTKSTQAENVSLP